MANSDQPRGLVPDGNPRRTNVYVAGSTINPGDPVAIAADGAIDAAAAGDGVQILGVAVGFATAGSDVQVYDHPDQLYQIQVDESVAATDVGASANLLATAADTTFKQSRMELDSSDIGTTATAQLRILGLRERANNAYGTNADVIVQINEHQVREGVPV